MTTDWGLRYGFWLSFHTAWVIFHSPCLCMDMPHPSTCSTCLVWIPRCPWEFHPPTLYIWAFPWSWLLVLLDKYLPCKFSPAWPHCQACCIPLLPTISTQIPSPTQEYYATGVSLSYSWDLFSRRSMTWLVSENRLLLCLGTEPPRSHNRGLWGSVMILIFYKAQILRWQLCGKWEIKITSFLWLLRKVITCLVWERKTNRIYKVIITHAVIPHRRVFFKQKLKGLHCGIRQRGQVWRDNILFGPAKNVII